MLFSIYNINNKMNLQDRELELNWREVTCKRSVQDDNFPRGIQDFDFSVSGKSAFIPSLSYFVIDAELTVRPTYQPVFYKDISNVGSVVSAQAIQVPIPVGPAAISKEAFFRRPSVADAISLADHFGSTLYNNAFFRAGNSDVSLITQYIPQAGVLKSRLDKSGAWTHNIGRIVTHDDPDFNRRRQYVSIDGKFHEDGLEPLQYTARKLYKQDGTLLNSILWQYTATGGLLSFTFNSATMTDPFLSGIQVGDVVQFTAAATLVPVAAAYDAFFRIDSVVTGSIFSPPVYQTVNGAIYQFVVTPVRGTKNLDIAAPAVGTPTFIYAAHDPACGSNITQVMFQPPIGIFSEANAISGGDFKISLNPSPNFKINGVQSLRALQPYSSLQLLGDYDLIIKDVRFYVATINSDVTPTGVIPLSLVEMAVLNKTLNSQNGGGSQNLDFTVPPSTLAITVFVQGASAGTNTIVPATKFYLQTGDGDPYPAGLNVNQINESLIDNLANNLQQIQVTYGSITKTQTLYNSQYSGLEGVNKNIQRFLQSIQYSGKIVSEGGAESQPQYLERGNYWHFDFSKDKNDTSSYVNVQLAFNGTIGTGNNLFIVAHYSRQCEISYENGFITQVISVNR
jgi:hypothetical protein